MWEAGSNIETDVDLLVSLVKKKGKISVEEAAKKLNINVKIVQEWVDFLVEEEVLGIEYKFVTPYLYFNKERNNKPTVLEESEGEYLEDKDDFIKKSRERGLNDDQIRKLWKNYLKVNIDEIKDHFYRRAKSKNISESKIDALWSKYRQELYEAI
ncbi:MAG: hypothetical protein ACQER9_03470 [Nanobdellota archaeon]